jgi:tetratricopeptide (TPR) repeat protein
MKKNLCSLIVAFCSVTLCIAQVPYNAAAPNGYTKKACVSEQVGLTNVSIVYHRPEVNNREGKIWGGVVHKGFIDQGFGSHRPAPWRAGANENTIIEFDNDVKVEGQLLQKGRYALFIAYDSLLSTVIFSKRTDGWGSFFYDEKEDALRVKVKPVAIAQAVENLKYEFTAQTPNSAVIALSWEKLSIPFKIEVDYLKQQYDAFVAEARNPRGFTAQGLNLAASWALQNNYELENALAWTNTATGNAFPGNPAFFPALSTKAAILDKLGRSGEAAATIKAALPFGTMAELQQLGKQLISASKPKEALEVFQFNYTKNGDQFITLTGMARGLSANGDYTNALQYGTKALSLAPNEASRQSVQKMVDKLKADEDIN